jgi:hypothetical protein
MAEPKPWSPDEGATLRRLHGERLSLNRIAKEMTRSRDTISRRAAELGLTFDRTMTEAATQASKVDAKARQTSLEHALLADVEDMRLLRPEGMTMREFQAFGQGLDAVVRAYANFKRTVPDDGGLEDARGFVDRILFAVQMTLFHDDETLINPVGVANPETGTIEIAKTFREAWNLRQDQIRGLAKVRRMA